VVVGVARSRVRHRVGRARGTTLPSSSPSASRARRWTRWPRSEEPAGGPHRARVVRRRRHPRDPNVHANAPEEASSRGAAAGE
jgi:hypothetical protein